jgi:uncharacterized protein
VRAVFDANVLVSGTLGYLRPSESAPGELLRRWQVKEFDLLTSAFLLEEVKRTLDSPYFVEHLTRDEREQALEALERRGLLVSISRAVIGIATHPEDDCVLATALNGKADVLVTGDRQLQSLRQFRGIPIMSPREFLTLLDKTREENPSTT